jgi:hypothetical protein
MANKYLKQQHIAVSATPYTIYTVPAANTAILSSLRVTNANSADATITIIAYPGGGATGYHLMRDIFLPVNATMDVFSGVPCVLEATDELEVESSESDVVFYLSYLEVDRN